MFRIDESYQYETAIIWWWEHNQWLMIADQYGSFIPVDGQTYVTVIIHGFYLPLLKEGGLPPTEQTLNYAIRLYCKEFAHRYICLN